MLYSKPDCPITVSVNLLPSRSFIRRQYFVATSTSHFTEAQNTSAIGRKRAHNRLGCDDFGAYGYENDDNQRRCP
jgi:hypothetical protein